MYFATWSQYGGETAFRNLTTMWRDNRFIILDCGTALTGTRPTS